MSGVHVPDALAHREYASLHAFRSWSSLLARHFFDKRLTVAHYVGMGPVFYDEREEHRDHGDNSPTSGGADASR